jgi:hypothetical protein
VTVQRLTKALAAAFSLVLAATVAGCASGSTATVPAGASTASALVGRTAPPTAVVPTASPDIALAVVAGDAQPVGEAMWELLEDGWDLGLDDHPWTIALEELDAAFEDVAGSTQPGEPFEVVATPMAVAALLVSLDREAAFYSTGGNPELAETYEVAAAHVRAQLTAEQAAEVLRHQTEPLATWADGL